MNFQAEGVFSMAKARRTQSMRPLTSHKIEKNIKTNAEIDSVSSISSSASLAEMKAADFQPIASTSTGLRSDSTSFKEVELQPLAEKSKRTGSVISINLEDASASTHSDGNIDPVRDGVYARIQKAMLRYGAAAGLGSVVGIGGWEEKLFSDDNNCTQVNNTGKHENPVNSTDLYEDSDEIINPLA